MHLLEKDKRRLEAIAIRSGIPLEDLRWSRGPAPDRKGPPESLQQCDILTESLTGYVFCFGAQTKDNPLFLRRPGDKALCREGRFDGVGEVEAEYTAWTREVANEREAVLEWPPDCSAGFALLHLLHSERTSLLKALYRYDFVPSDFLWRPFDTGGVVIHRKDSKFSLGLKRHGSSIDFWLAPAETQSHRNEDGRSVTLLPAIFDEWAAAMRSEDEAISHVHMEGSAQTRHLYGDLFSFKLENIRGFERLEWQSAGKGQRTLVIIGPNGTGKTTLLRCLTLLLLPRQLASSLLVSPYCRLLRRGQQKGCVEAVFKSGDREMKAHLTIEARGDVEEITAHWSDEADEFVDVLRVYAYGVGRSSDGTRRSEDPRLEAVNSLFFYGQPLVSPANVVLKLQATDHRHGSRELESVLKRCLRDLLQQEENFELELQPPQGVMVITEQGKLPLSSWADGYRLTLGWILDLWNSALTLGDLRPTNGVLSSPQGILLLDEIEQHAHPKLQLQQVLGLQRALPNLFHVVTTHSPLVTLGVPSSSLLVLKPEGDRVIAVEPPDYSRFTIDEVYRDRSLFDTSPQSVEAEEKLKRWKGLIEKPWDKRTEKDQSELDELSRWFANV